MMTLSTKQAKKLASLLNTLDRARRQMEHPDLYDLTAAWRGSMNLRDNISEFIAWQDKKLPRSE